MLGLFIGILALVVVFSVVAGVKTTIEPEPPEGEEDTRARGTFVILFILAIAAGIIGADLLAVATGIK